MGEKIEEYLDNAGNTVRDDDTVVYKGREYRVAYISHLYVNLDGGRGNWLHLPFHVGVPERKIPNAPNSAQPGPVRTVTTARHEIVDGHYGHLRVTRCPAYPMGVVSIDLMYHGWWSENELTGLIDTLTAIRDAMQANTTA